jgi:membrane dipeptidase
MKMILVSSLVALAATLSAGEEDPALRHARELLRTVPLVDGHNDTPWLIRENAKSRGDVALYDLRSHAPDETDLARLREGGVSAQFWSVWIPSVDQGSARMQLEQIDLARRMIARYPEALVFATRASDIEAARKAGKIASFLGSENGRAIENDLSLLRAYYDLGVRYMTLTHGRNTDWADSATDTPRHGGLTPFGREVVREMNRLGMLVDLSHVAPTVMEQALDVSEAPVIFSHSSARGLVEHPRNVPDSVLARMAKNRGVVMVTFVPFFVSKEVAEWARPMETAMQGITNAGDIQKLKAENEAKHGPAPKATLSQVADHVEYVAKVAGVDHVGIGSDFDGDGGPQGLEDTTRFPYLFAELIRRGWKDQDLAKLAGGNLIRTLSEAEEVAARLQKERPPSLKTIDELDGAPAKTGQRGVATGTGQQMGALFFDPEGADFTVWINHFKNEVYRNWIIPEPVYLGVRGHVDIQFTVEHDGKVSSVRIVKTSTTTALDRAAERAIESSKFLPLPADYSPPRVTMQVGFFYNEGRRSS